MPSLKTRNLFISHAWTYDSHYWKILEWFDDAPNFNWKNYSVPSHDGCSKIRGHNIQFYCIVHMVIIPKVIIPAEKQVLCSLSL
jgi:hypothetical protein